ncbi:hypothetical protein [Vulcanisaeta thermophila]|uniref:hypothetical protein n=1 Tax=Vulcanisaeta thermophila TaxID=867917 RepID=UPI000853114B|nr:hypothetical protein [Vulcanisaeta thermophila]
MSNQVIDTNVSLDYLINKASENKAYILSYIDFIIKAYNEIMMNKANLPEDSKRVVMNIPNAIPIIIHNGLSRKSYIELLGRALEFLKINYAIYDYLENRLKNIKERGGDVKLIVRYFGDTPATVVIQLDDNKQ